MSRVKDLADVAELGKVDSLRRNHRHESFIGMKVVPVVPIDSVYAQAEGNDKNDDDRDSLPRNL